MEQELQNLFSDPKSARKAWKAIGAAIASRPAVHPIVTYDKDGNPTLNSCIEDYSYKKLEHDLKTLALGRNEPTELEMIFQCQIIKARTDTAAATFVRDTLGAKPVDESKLDASVTGPYESLTDEELALIAEHRRQAKLNEALPENIAAAYNAEHNSSQDSSQDRSASHTLVDTAEELAYDTAEELLDDVLGTEPSPAAGPTGPRHTLVETLVDVGDGE